MSTELNNQQEPDTIDETHLPIVSRATARLTYNFLMPGMIARVLLYLFGEVDRDDIEKALKLITEHRTVFNQIIDEKRPPLRVIYEYLVEHQIIEHQNLGREAILFLDQPDALQSRIELTEEERKRMESRAADVRKILANVRWSAPHSSNYTVLYGTNRNSRQEP